MSNTDLKAKTAGGTAAFAEAGTGLDGGASFHPHTIIDCPPLSIPQRRRLDPKAGALIKLDVVEHRLHTANTIGDSDTWARYYLAWLRLHAVAFGYGREGN